MAPGVQQALWGLCPPHALDLQRYQPGQAPPADLSARLGQMSLAAPLAQSGQGPLSVPAAPRVRDILGMQGSSNPTNDQAI